MDGLGVVKQAQGPKEGRPGRARSTGPAGRQNGGGCRGREEPGNGGPPAGHEEGIPRTSTACHAGGHQGQRARPKARLISGAAANSGSERARTAQLSPPLTPSHGIRSTSRLAVRPWSSRLSRHVLQVAFRVVPFNLNMSHDSVPSLALEVALLETTRPGSLKLMTKLMPVASRACLEIRLLLP